MIETRRLQRAFADGLIAEEVSDLWEPWMLHADQAIDDEQLLEIVQEALSQRCRKSKTRCRRPLATAEVALRLMLLKHVRNWSYADLQREVRANLVLSPIHAYWRREGSRRQDHGRPRPAVGAGGDPQGA